MPEGSVEEASALRRRIWNYWASGQAYQAAKNEAEHARAKPWYDAVKAQGDRLFTPLPAPSELVGRQTIWFRSEMNYDPLMALRNLRVPVLFLFGDADRITPVDESVRAIQRVMRKVRKKISRFRF